MPYTPHKQEELARQEYLNIDRLLKVLFFTKSYLSKHFLPQFTPYHHPNKATFQCRRMFFPEAVQALSAGAWVALLVTTLVLWMSWRFNLQGSFQAYVYDKRYVEGVSLLWYRQQWVKWGEMEESETLLSCT